MLFEHETLLLHTHSHDASLLASKWQLQASTGILPVASTVGAIDTVFPCLTPNNAMTFLFSIHRDSCHLIREIIHYINCTGL